MLLSCTFPYCSSANLLGSGGFGAVYKATYRNKPVAVKIFSEKAAKINNTTPNYLLRLEVVCVCMCVCVCVCVRKKIFSLGTLPRPKKNSKLGTWPRLGMDKTTGCAYSTKVQVGLRVPTP